MNERKRVQLEGGGGGGVLAASPPRAALTRLAELPAPRAPRRPEVWRRRRTPRPRRKNNALWRRAPPARGRRATRGAPLGGAREGRGVARGAAGTQSFDACRASGCRAGITSVVRSSCRRPARDGRCMSDRWSRRARRSWSARRGPRAARACASKVGSGATPSRSIPCWRRVRATSRCRRC